MSRQQKAPQSLVPHNPHTPPHTPVEKGFLASGTRVVYLVLHLPVQLFALGSVGLLQLLKHAGQQSSRVAAGLQILGSRNVIRGCCTAEAVGTLLQGGAEGSEAGGGAG